MVNDTISYIRTDLLGVGPNLKACSKSTKNMIQVQQASFEKWYCPHDQKVALSEINQRGIAVHFNVEADKRT